MQMLPPYFHRAPVRAATFCLLLATALTGCASKNPLMEEPKPVAAKADSTSMPAIDAQTSTSATDEKLASAATVPARENTTTGVQTEKGKRFLGIFRPYRPDIQQGNFVSQEMVAQLKPGLTQDQVVFLLGTPLLTDVFHSDRWDYAFRMQKGNGEITTSRVTVFFKDKLVSSFEGGDLPTEKDYLNRITDKAKIK